MLAAVVICRNEERWIERSLRAALAAVDPYAGAEVVLVDSCSSDGTVERALRLPVRVVELRDDVATSPALGRLVGQALTRSRYLLFVDGDTEIDAAWVAAAVDHLETHPGVGGVDGALAEVWYDGERVVGGSPDVFGAPSEAAEVGFLGGNAVFRRAALDRAGSYNPFVVSYEEAELAARLRQAGATVVRLPMRMGTHHTLPRGSLQELGRRYRNNLIKGYGQVLRLGLRQGTFREHAWNMRRYLQFQAVLVIGLLAGLVALVTRDARWITASAALGIGLLLLFMLRSRSVAKPFRLLADWMVWTPPMLRGFLESPRDPHTVRPLEAIARQRTGQGTAEPAAGTA
jgi:glycosyltransferase involved in cell wall biosynthesis